MVMSTTTWATFLTHYSASGDEGGWLLPETRDYLEKIWTVAWGLRDIQYGMGQWGLQPPSDHFAIVRGSAGSMGALPIIARTVDGKRIWVFVNQFGADASGVLLPEYPCTGETHLLEHIAAFLADKTAGKFQGDKAATTPTGW